MLNFILRRLFIMVPMVLLVLTIAFFMVRAAPDRFFVPPYVGPSGWIGVYLDSPRTDWDELAELLRDAWRLSARKKLVNRTESAPAPAKKVAAKRPATKKKPAAKRSLPRKRD